VSDGELAAQGAERGPSLQSALSAVRKAKRAAVNLRAARRQLEQAAQVGEARGMVAALEAKESARRSYRHWHGRASRLVQALRTTPTASTYMPSESEYLQTAEGVADPDSTMESKALSAITRTKQAALALENSRSAVVRLKQLGDVKGASAALKAELEAKRAFVTARQAALPVVAEARAKYDRTQGTAIQSMARDVARQTWRSMTGKRLVAESAATKRAAKKVGYDFAIPERQIKDVKRARLAVARKYLHEAKKAEEAAAKEQHNSDEAVHEVEEPLKAEGKLARYAQLAKAAMQHTLAAQDNVHQRINALKRAAARFADDGKKAGSRGTGGHGRGRDESPEDTISNAERQVASSMRTVNNAAQKFGLGDNSWNSKIKNLLKNGQTAAAQEAAQQYVNNHVGREVTMTKQRSSIHSAAAQVKSAQEKILKAAQKQQKPSKALA